MTRPPLLVLRPEPGNGDSCARAQAAGWHPVAAPLFDIFPLPWQAPAPGGFDALLLTSANALRHGGPALAAYRALPVHAVGRATAEAAERAGFVVATVGRGGAIAAYDNAIATGHRRLLRLAGADHVPLPGGVATRMVYAARRLPLGARAVAALSAGPVVALLHSAAAARHFATAVDIRGLPRAPHRIAALAPQVAQAAGTGWAAVAAAAVPDDDALLSVAERLATSDVTGADEEGTG